uniref:TFIID subunit TAF5 NTD2 domain-containing protein n=1 Tax=Chrysotila carterae TaxID=13221 RepID=A0A7S4BAV7_CHRCT
MLSTLDALVLLHLKEQGYEAAAEAMQKALGNQVDTAAASGDSSRPSLLRYLTRRGGERRGHDYAIISEWARGTLAEYKVELCRVLYPLFAFCYLDIVASGERDCAASFFETFHGDHSLVHREELNQLRQVTAPEQERQNEYVTRLRSRRYEVEMSAFSRTLLLHFMHEHDLLCAPRPGLVSLCPP